MWGHLWFRRPGLFFLWSCVVDRAGPALQLLGERVCSCTDPLLCWKHGWGRVIWSKPGQGEDLFGLPLEPGCSFLASLATGRVTVAGGYHSWGLAWDTVPPSGQFLVSEYLNLVMYDGTLAPGLLCMKINKSSPFLFKPHVFTLWNSHAEVSWLHANGKDKNAFSRG